LASLLALISVRIGCVRVELPVEVSPPFPHAEGTSAPPVRAEETVLRALVGRAHTT